VSETIRRPRINSTRLSPEGAAHDTPSAPRWLTPLPLASASALVAAVAAAVLFWALNASPGPVHQPVVRSAAPPQPTCAAGQAWLDVLKTNQQQGRWRLAVANAQAALQTPGLCESDRQVLAQTLLAAAGEALFEDPAQPEDVPGQRAAADAYRDLKALAREFGLSAPPPLQVARRAYDSHLFMLTTSALEDALGTGATSTTNRDVLRAYYAARRNLGLAWVERAGAAARDDGLRQLATACALSERYELGSDEACSDLTRLVGPRNRWPAPLVDPFLARLSTTTGANTTD
jgi:hypothetical protein